MSKYYYDIEGNEYEIVNREPTEEERKRAKESLEKEKEFMAYGPFDHPFKRVLLNDEHKYLNCYREFYHDRDENAKFNLIKEGINILTNDLKIPII